MRDIERFITIWAGGMIPANNDYYVRYDDHRAEVERVMADVVKLRIDLNSAQVEANQRRGEVERLIAERDEIHAEVQRLTQILNGRRATTDRVIAERNEAQVEVERLKNAIDHLTSERDEARGEVERLTARQTEMETHITGLTAELHRTRADGIELRWVEGEVEQLTAQRDAAQAEVERLKEQVGALTLAVEQADEMKAHAEAAAAAEEAETDRVMAERDAAQVEVERLKNALDHLTSERDEARDERDAVQRERERVEALLWLRGRELPTLQRDQSAQNLDMVSGQAILDSSRPTDEDIWREVFFRCVSEYITGEKRVIIADTMLAEYRKRWPR